MLGLAGTVQCARRVAEVLADSGMYVAHLRGPSGPSSLSSLRLKGDLLGAPLCARRLSTTMVLCTAGLLLWVIGDLGRGPAVGGLDRPLGSVQVDGVLSSQGSLVPYASSVLQPTQKCSSNYA